MRFSKFIYFKNRIFWSRNEENKNGKKIAEIIRLHFKLDLSVRQTSSALNVSRSSVGDNREKISKKFKISLS
ncbi:hypothetical protein [Aliarcobacter cryaerophilus]|uniref:hypothetical protein n=1 Tax=Aliarcobacter cryaerophilus TaxID=28198 RepID=UPI0021B6243F|nr:hypothetical protein [Aliarcobacter cryaerophilus]MCT7482739.1 hypothetical protein [Aliarcobacter cryaerophilus]